MALSKMAMTSERKKVKKPRKDGLSEEQWAKAKAIRKKNRFKFTLEKRRSLSGYVFAAPWIVGFLIFMAYPLLTSFWVSINELGSYSDFPNNMTFVGLEHYAALFNNDIEFMPAFWQTLKLVVLYTPFIVVIALVIAILLNQKIKGKGFFRSIFFLPVLLGSGIAMAQITGSGMGNLMEMPEAVKNYIQYSFSLDFATVITSTLEEITRMFWKMGVQIIIFIGALQSIPDSYYEAAKVDSATSWDQLWKVTLPILSPTIFLNTIYTIIDHFRSADNPITGLIIKELGGRFAYGSAMGWVYFALSFAMVGLVALLFRKYIYYEK